MSKRHTSNAASPGSVAVLERLLRDATATSRFDGSAHELFPVATSAAEGEALRDWILRERAAETIEIGLGYGISALFICMAHNGKHVVVDPHQATRFSNLGLQHLEEAGVADRVEHHAAASKDVLPQLLAVGRRFDFAFVDGSHLFEAVLFDLTYVARLVRPGNIVFVDDYQLADVARAVSLVDCTIEEISPPDEHHQWAVLRTAH